MIVLPVTFAKRVEALPTGCWKWLGSRDHRGYGSYYTGDYLHHPRRGVEWAHRFSYNHFKGNIEQGLELDHLCRNTWCVNPLHLEAVTKAVNLGRGTHINREKTHCKWGHPLSGA